MPNSRVETTEPRAAAAPSRVAYEPALWIFAGVLMLTAVVTFTQLYENAALYPVAKRAWGNDFRFFYNGAKLFLEGLSPYLDPYYTSPPPTAMCFGLLALLPFGVAYTLVFAFSIVFCYLGIWLLNRQILGGEVAIERNVVFLTTGAGLLLGFPFQFLIERGNIDALILILVVLSLIFLPKNEPISGAWLGLASALKIYPLLLFVPLLVTRRWRAVASGALTFLVLGVVTANHWGDWVRQFATRDQGFRIDENASLANTVAHLINAVQPDMHSFPMAWATRTGTLLFILLLILLLSADYRRSASTSKEETIAHILLYFPLMVSFPNLVHNYELVFVLAMVPGICWLWRHRPDSSPRGAVTMLVIGASLSQLQAVSLQRLWDDVSPHAFPSVGLLLMCLGATWIKFSSVSTGVVEGASKTP